MFKDDRVMSILTGLVIIATMATIAQRSDSLLAYFMKDTPEAVKPVNDQALTYAGEPVVVDVLANDENILPEDRDNLHIVVAPSCGAAEARADGVLYISNDNCVGAQLFSYCVDRRGDCPEASVTVQVAPAAMRLRPAARDARTVAMAPRTPAPRTATETRVAPADIQPPREAAAPAAPVRTADDVAAPAGAETRLAALTPAPEASAPAGGMAATVQPLADAPGQATRAAEAPLVTDDGGAGPATPEVLAGLEVAGLMAPEMTATELFTPPETGEAPTGMRFAALELDATVEDRDAPDLSDIRALGGVTTPAPRARAETAPAAGPETGEADPGMAAETASVVASLSVADDAGGATIKQLRDDAARSAVERPAASAPVPAPAPAAGDCAAPEIATREEPGGAMRVVLTSACRTSQVFTLEHAGLQFSARFDAEGRAGITVPILDASSPARLRLADGVEIETPLVYRARDLENVQRIAVAWTAPVNLDLHAFEYASGFGGDGHVWEQHPRAFRDVRRAGGGYHQAFAPAFDGGQSIEVYTFWTSRRARPGHMRIALDHASRGDMPAGDFCGAGALAAPEYTVLRSEFGRITDRSAGRFAPAACGRSLSVNARYAGGALSDLRITR